MSDNFNGLDQSVDQIPSQLNANKDEFGLNPPNLVEIVRKDFSKVYAYLRGWDIVNTIWRAIRVDASGNIRITNGTQNAVPVSVTSATLTSTPTQELSINSSRSAYAIINDGNHNNQKHDKIQLTYPNPASAAFFDIPAGFIFIDDSWSGTIQLSVTGAITDQICTLIEYT